MPLIKCSECGKEISDTATACPNCGSRNTPVNISIRRTGKIFGTFGLIIYSVFAIVMIGLLFIFNRTFAWIFLIIFALIWWRWIYFLRRSR